MVTSIKKQSLFVVQTNDTVNSIRYDTLKNQIAPLAKQAIANQVAVPGLMYPGKGLEYNPSTGELSARASSAREYLGLTGYDTVNGQFPGSKGGELPGSFYVVADYTYKYTTNDWSTLGSDLVTNMTRVYIGDVIERDESYNWRLIPMQIGSQHVHNDFSKYPHISYVRKNTLISTGDTGATYDGTVLETSGY